jgi:hypothetical protein
MKGQFPFDVDDDLDRIDAEVSRSGRAWLLLPPVALTAVAVIVWLLSS